ncbi:MAG: uracil-DNA glycosylase [Candidatus Viridilinea halotolerans]|uniref:Type-4 uracil-DNA glycosylase n=1 Tax=Candidatus Viridilinea halotolerans TaxID=2491704 RepID=A0A426TY08_9CHLR|nr:MAG: uracil-DNA glycosylase [Candidatus Viridilinea halotolerans]
MSAAETIRLIAETTRACRLCGLHMGRTNAVPGEGPPTAKIMLIGEGPGLHEDRQGRPFVGPSGKFLDQLLAMAGLERHEVFIGNVIKCRPPQNRDPQPEEIQVCTENYLFRQIEAINPAVIVTLGRFSMGLFLPGERIMRIHGQPRRVNGRLIVPMLHPAAALHQPQNRPLLEADFQRLPEFLAQVEHERAARPASARPAPEPEDDQPLQQMSLF